MTDAQTGLSQKSEHRPPREMNGNLKALAEGFSALNKRLAFDSKLPKIRTWAHAKHWWAQAKHYTGNDFHASTLASWTVLDGRHSYHMLFQLVMRLGTGFDSHRPLQKSRMFHALRMQAFVFAGALGCTLSSSQAGPLGSLAHCPG